MTTKLGPAIILVPLLFVCSRVQAADDAAVVRKATSLLEEIAANPDSGIRAQDLQDAAGIIIMPGMVETQFAAGRKRGQGVFLSRTKNGEWGYPKAVEVSGVSVGAVAGREVTDLVLIYRTQKAADDDGDHTLFLGLRVRASSSLKHAARFHGPEAWGDMKQDILLYERHHGLVAGASFVGELKWRSSVPLVGSTTAIADEGTAANAATKTTVPHDAGASRTKTKLAVDPREISRLKRVLTAVTAKPPPQVAQSRASDVKVSPASGVKPVAQTTARAE
jgi:lipid-binding SYLF domain-containing protein